jgi:lipopolysaccharide biosynthesis regulator YciM
MEALGFIFVIVLILSALFFFYQWASTRTRVRRETPSPYTLGLEALLAGDREEAFRRFKEAVGEDSDNVDAYLRLGELLRLRGQLDRAIRVHQYLTARTSLPRRVVTRIYRALAQDYLAAKTPQRALTLLEERVRLDTHDPLLLEMLRDLYEQEGRWDEAYRTEESSLRARKIDDPRRLARYLCLVGEEKMKAGDEEGSLASFQKALQLDGSSIWGHLYAGDLLYHRGRVDEAIGHWHRILSVHPDAAHHTYGRLERAYYDLGKFEEITRIYDDVLRRNPRDYRTMLSRAAIERKKGNAVDSLRLCRKAVDVAPRSLEARLALLESHLKQDGALSAEAANLLASLISESGNTSCPHCGNQIADLSVRCSVCRSWLQEG